MRKLLALLLMVTLLGTFMVGCTSTASEGSSDANEAVSNEEEALSAILLIPGNLGDKSFFDAAYAGLQLVEEELGAKTKVIEMGTDSTKWEPTLLDAIEGDWDLIITGNSMTELLGEIAPLYPEQKFINFDTFIQETPDNVYAMFYSTNEVSFLAGAAAALITESDMSLANEENIIGFLGGMDIPGINDFLVGYIQGAQYVNPDVKVTVSYAGDFNDPAKGKELSLVMYNNGADVIFNVAGGTGLGVMDAAKEKDQYAIGVDSDQAMLFDETDPEKASHIITSAVKQIDDAILRACTLYTEDALAFGVHEELGVLEGGVGLAKNKYYEQLPQEIQDELEVIEGKIAAGEIEVQSGFGLTSDEISALRDSVRP